MKKNSSPIIHIVMLLAVVGGVIYLYYLLQQSLVLTKKLQSEVDLATADQTRLKLLSSQMPILANENTAWLKTLPKTEDDVAQFAAFVEQLAKVQGLKIVIHFEDFPKMSMISGTNMSSLGTDIILDGSFQGLTSFISQISGSNYFFKIDKLSIIKLETKPGVKATLNGSLIMNLNNLK